MIKFVLAIASIILSSFAQIMLKKGSAVLNSGSGDGVVAQLLKIASNAYVWGGVLAYGLSTLLWLYVLSKMKLSVAYPLASLSYVLVVVGSYYFLGESISLNQKFALGFILIGVVLLMK